MTIRHRQAYPPTKDGLLRIDEEPSRCRFCHRWQWICWEEPCEEMEQIIKKVKAFRIVVGLAIWAWIVIIYLFS